MDIEHDVRMIPIDDKLQSEVEKLQKEGWQLAPGCPPMAIYHVVRLKQQAGHVTAAAGELKLQIDDSKVFVMKPDGTLQ